MFIDQAKIWVKSGKGGNGVCSFRREKFVPFGGPDGGDGGNGGHVILQASTRITTLLDLKYQRHYEAQAGHAGAGSNCHGRKGGNLVIQLPLGTIIKHEATGELIADLVTDGETVVVARGGKGGRGNSHFATSTNRAPQECEQGGPAEEHWLLLELKLLADVGLVGFPNAGKSTLISTVSAAKPEIANYPFTTLKPHLGVVSLGDFHHCVMADIPGLIEGAHEGKGLGLQFLKHIQRTAILLYLIDVSEWSLDDPVHNYQVLKQELGMFDPELGNRPFAVVATKIDAQGTGDALQKLQQFCQHAHIPFFSISSATREGLPPLLDFIATQLEKVRALSCDIPNREGKTTGGQNRQQPSGLPNIRPTHGSNTAIGQGIDRTQEPKTRNSARDFGRDTGRH